MVIPVLFKRFLIYLLVFCLLVGATATISAETVADTEELITFTVSNIDEPLVLPSIKTSADSIEYFSSAVSITNTNEVKWIDRLANKPDYAVSFYDWLKTNSASSSGRLATVKDETLSDGTQAHKVTSYTGSFDFNFTPGGSEDVIFAAVDAAAPEFVNPNFNSAVEWIVAVYSAFDRDCPEVFWLSGVSITYNSVKYVLSINRNTGKGTAYYTQDVYFYLHNSRFDIRSANYTTTSSISSAIAKRDSAVNKIINGCKSLSDYEKIKYINNYLTKNNCYNGETAYSYDAYECISALLGGTGVNAPVCEGYAKAFKVLCDKLSIPCVLVNGDAGGAHMWNNVMLNGYWFAVDVTWNDPIGSINAIVSGYENENYLLVGSDTVINRLKFSESHIMQNTVTQGGTAFVNGPALASLSYNEMKVFNVNGDGVLVDICDLVYLKNILLGNVNSNSGDCNSDGSVNSLDFTVLRQRIWEEF